MADEASFAWIFQANPKRFDTSKFAAMPPGECEWLVSRYRSEIRPGQRVFLWCAAGDPNLPSGVFAEGVTVSAVREIPDGGPAELWADPSESARAKPRVRIALRRIAGRDEVIGRGRWKAAPELADHLLITMPNHTTFKIQGAAYQRLDRWWAESGGARGGDSTTLPAGGPKHAASGGGLARVLFEQEFQWFTAEIERVSREPFRSFQSGLVADWEDYKPLVRQEALRRLDLPTWSATSWGSGEILERTINAIEINVSKALRNNLVGWQNQYGHASRSHRALLDARGDAVRTAELERLLLDFFKTGLSEHDAFQRLKDVGVRSYDLTAYLFYLLDGDRYMPIRPMTFDPVLKRLGFEFTTTSRCSLDNYTRYNDALREVQYALTHVAGLEGVRLIDAHSFCWILGRIDQAQPSLPPKKTEGGSVVVYDARRRSIYMMVANALAAAQAGNGQVVERTMKNKEVRMSRQALEAYVDALIDKQEGRCALTGLALQFHKDHDDEQLLASLDRIDSDGHYEAGNLQVVCRFANRWKSDSDTEEFVRLLSLVRQVA